MSAIILDKITQVSWHTHKPVHITHTHTHTVSHVLWHTTQTQTRTHTNTHTHTHTKTTSHTQPFLKICTGDITHTHTVWLNISDDLYVDRPSSVVEIFRMKEDYQTGQEQSLSAINRSHKSLVKIMRRSTFRTRVDTVCIESGPGHTLLVIIYT